MCRLVSIKFLILFSVSTAIFSSTITLGDELPVVRPSSHLASPHLEGAPQIYAPIFADSSQGADLSQAQINPVEFATGTNSALIQNENLTISKLEEIAFQSNPTLSAAAARIAAVKGRHYQAGRYPNPVFGYHATEVGNNGTAGAQGAFVRQKFIRGGKLQLDQAIVSKEIDEACFRLQAQEQRVLNDLHIRYYDTLIAQRRVELTRDLSAIGDELVNATEKLFKGRLGTENDLLQAEIKADESHILLDNSTNQQIAAWRRLVAVVGTPNMQVSRLEGEIESNLPQLDWGSCYAVVLNSNPELNAARAKADQASIAYQRARVESISDVDVMLSARHANSSGYNIANILIGVPIPIFDRNEGNIKDARYRWFALNKEVERIELDLQDQLAVTFQRYANAKQQAERYSERMIPRAKRSLMLVTEGYEKRQVNYLTLLTAQQTYLQVNLSYLDSLRELWTASTIIEGQLLTGSLSRGR